MPPKPKKLSKLWTVTPERLQKFAEYLSETNLLYNSAQRAGFSKDALDRWRKANPEEMDALIEACRAKFVERLETEAMRRAVEGVERVRFYQGKIVYRTDPMTGQYVLDDEGKPIPETYMEYSDKLLEKLLLANARTKYAERVDVTGNIDHSVKAGVLVVSEKRSEADWEDVYGSLKDVTPVQKKIADE